MAIPTSTRTAHYGQPVSSMYQRLEIIGKGKFGTVHKGLKLDTKELVAIKILNLDTDEEEVKDVQMEVNFLSQLSSVPNITHYYGSYLNGSKLWIIMDYCAAGSVRTLLRPGPFDEKYTSIIIREALQGLAAVHQHGVIHRDLKAANILITKDGRVQICDFGVAAQLTANALKRTTMAGTPYWMAPEVIMEGAMYNVKADIWSLGVTIYEMTTGNPPYSDKDAIRAMQLITNHEPPRLEGRQYSPILREIVAMCLDENPETRPSAEELSRSKFIKTYKQLPTTTLKEVISKYLLWRDTRVANHNANNNNNNANVPNHSSTVNQSPMVDDNESEISSIHNMDDDPDIKWDFDSLNSAEYIIENDINMDEIIEADEHVQYDDNYNDNDDYAMNTAFMSHLNTHHAVGSTIRDNHNTTFRAGGVTTAGIGAPAFMNTRTATHTSNRNNNNYTSTVGRSMARMNNMNNINMNTNNNHTNTNPTVGATSSKPPKAPKSLLKLFDENDDDDDDEEDQDDDDEEGYADDGDHSNMAHPSSTAGTSVDNSMNNTGMLADGSTREGTNLKIVPERPEISSTPSEIVIPEMDDLPLSTTTSNSTSNSMSTNNTNPTTATTVHASIASAVQSRSRAPTITASLSNLSVHHPEDLSAHQGIPQLTRRTTISNPSVRRTPSPKKQQLMEVNTLSPTRRVSPPHMKPMSYSSQQQQQQQLLLQPINTKLSTLPSGPQTAPIKSHNDMDHTDPFVARRGTTTINEENENPLSNAASASTSTIPSHLIQRSRSQLRLQMPKPISFPSVSSGMYNHEDSSGETNQFGVNVNSASVVAMTPASERPPMLGTSHTPDKHLNNQNMVNNNVSIEGSPGAIPSAVSSSANATITAGAALPIGNNGNSATNIAPGLGLVTNGSHDGPISLNFSKNPESRRKLITNGSESELFNGNIGSSTSNLAASAIPEDLAEMDFEQRLAQLGITLNLSSCAMDPFVDKSDLINETKVLSANISKLLHVLGDEFEMS